MIRFPGQIQRIPPAVFGNFRPIRNTMARPTFQPQLKPEFQKIADQNQAKGGTFYAGGNPNFNMMGPTRFKAQPALSPDIAPMEEPVSMVAPDVAQPAIAEQNPTFDKFRIFQELLAQQNQPIGINRPDLEQQPVQQPPRFMPQPRPFMGGGYGGGFMPQFNPFMGGGYGGGFMPQPSPFMGGGYGGGFMPQPNPFMGGGYGGGFMPQPSPFMGGGYGGGFMPQPSPFMGGGYGGGFMPQPSPFMRGGFQQQPMPQQPMPQQASPFGSALRSFGGPQGQMMGGGLF